VDATTASQAPAWSDEEEDWEDDEPDSGFLADGSPPPGTKDQYGNPIFVVIDRSGIHHIGVHVCQCPNAKPIDIQLLEMGIYPASQKRPKTGFTFRVLDDFLVDNRECKVAALAFYSKLRRLTSNAFPHLSPVSVFLVTNVSSVLTRHLLGPI